MAKLFLSLILFSLLTLSLDQGIFLLPALILGTNCVSLALVSESGHVSLVLGSEIKMLLSLDQGSQSGRSAIGWVPAPVVLFTPQCTCRRKSEQPGHETTQIILSCLVQATQRGNISNISKQLNGSML